MKYADELKDAIEIAKYIDCQSSDDVDRERIEENFFGCRAKLQEVLIDNLVSEGPEHHQISKNKQSKYNKMSFDSCPPIVVENNVIIDGHHRVRAAKFQKIKTILAYVIIED